MISKEMVNDDHAYNRSFYSMKENDILASFCVLLSIIWIAVIDPQIELQDKLLLQSSGVSHFLDTYSDAFSVVVIAYHMVKKNEWDMVSKPLKMSYFGEIAFGIVATHFHAVGAEESAGKDGPHPFYCCYFSVVGSFILYWHVRGLIDHVSCSSTQKSLTMKVKARFACLATIPFLLYFVGAPSAINRFLFNGYVFVYCSIAMDPILKQAKKDATSSFTRWKLNLLRFFFPIIFVAYATESLCAEKFNFDTHCIVHILVLAYVLLIHSCLYCTHI